MLTGRHIFSAVLVVLALSLVGMAFSLWQDLQPSPLGGDSFGTRAQGQRGVFELLGALNVPVERSLLPPRIAQDHPATLVLWGPHNALMQLEPRYLREIRDWVHAGGRVVVGLPRPNTDELFARATRADKSEQEVSILEELGLEKVTTKLVDLDEPKPAESGQDADEHPTSRPQNTELFSIRDPQTTTVLIACDGDLQDWKETIAELTVPQWQLQVLDTSALAPTGRLSIKHAVDAERTLVASYRAGQGQIVLVGDPELLENHLLGLTDNSLLAWRLLVVPGRAVVWDEFYHGLTIRGNPVYLLRREPFGALMVAILILIAVCVWRQAVRFGPPISLPPTPRRTLGEYVETMARMFQRSRGSQRFLLSETRTGMLWWLRVELGLRPGRERLEPIVAVLRRKRPEQAVRLSDAVRSIDRALAAEHDLPEKETVLTLQRITACL